MADGGSAWSADPQGRGTYRAGRSVTVEGTLALLLDTQGPRLDALGQFAATLVGAQAHPGSVIGDAEIGGRDLPLRIAGAIRHARPVPAGAPHAPP